MGHSLEPIIGRGAILIVDTDPEYITIGDMVTVISGRAIDFPGTIRKVVVDMETDWSTDEVWVHLMDEQRTIDWGWFPVWAVRTKVACVIFRGFVCKENCRRGE